jgi:uncharacterized NAD(P)/FAD-binding protein YdhS
MDGRAPLTDAGGLTIAIVGGGFSGAAMAIHLARAAAPGLRILLFEPCAQPGLGLAYGTTEPAHRVNARAARMSLFPDEPAHFRDWVLATGACTDDAQATLPDGRLYPRRAVFGRYVAAQLAPLLESGRVIHVRDCVEDLAWAGAAWLVRAASGQVHDAEIVVLATGQAPAVAPPVLAPLAGHPAFIAAPLTQGLASIARDAAVLIVGTGLTMADAVAALDRQGHTGKICAISRRGQAPRPHAEAEHPPWRAFGDPPATARTLLRRVRAAVRQAAAAGLPWQSVFDGLRCEAQTLWSALPPAERRRLLRHARPFWDTHRFRLPPPVGDVLRRRLDDGSLAIRAASLIGAAPDGARLRVRLRDTRTGLTADESFDAILVTAGFGRIGESGHGLVCKLLAAGLVAIDETGQGLRCDPQGRAVAETMPGPLYLLGPPARGSFADVTGVPEIARLASVIAKEIGSKAKGLCPLEPRWGRKAPDPRPSAAP